MASRINPSEISSTDLMIALNEVFPERSYGAIPVIDQFEALETYLAFEDGGLAEAPNALAAYVSQQQHHTY